MRLSRRDRSLLSEWWFTIDRLMLGAILIIICTGLFVSLAASPPIALKNDLEAFYFFKRHMLFFLPTLLLLFVISLLSPKQMRRLCLIIFVFGLLLMGGILIFGQEVNGAKRWLQWGSFSLQPSEFVKTAFIVVSAWFFTQKDLRPDMPATPFVITGYLVFIALLVLQPDIGQAFLVTLVWMGLFFISGLQWRWVGLFSGLMCSAFVLAYVALPHVKIRIDRFLNPESGENYQIQRALQSFREGGFWGVGPGEGKLKHILPDAHTDFIYAVIAEEYGIIACIMLLSVFAFIVLRGLINAASERDLFNRFAISGLIILLGLQCIINISVNVGLLPAKGMTLPFISYGGSSLMATALAMGMVLGLTRKRPETYI
ncbi:MAG: putative lipid II flippase FtsW [Pseudomonadota bacterium]